MATSGTYGFTVTRDEIIASALRLTTRFASGDVIPADDITNCAQALNMFCKEVVTEGMPLWCVQDVEIPFVAGQSKYNLATATGNTRPLRILDAYWRSAAGNDVQLTPISRFDYDQMGNKSSPGSPNQYWYDAQLSSPVIVLYNVPDDATSKLHVVIQRQAQDFNLATDTPDFPQEAYRMLKWGLADEIALEYAAPTQVRLEISQKAQAYRQSFFASTQDSASVTFSPNLRGM